MFCWRITKYDPKYRDSRGAFLKNDWISFSEVGDIFEGKKLTIEDYLKVENAYVASVILFMECLKLKSLRITNLEKHNPPEKNNPYSESMISIFNSIKQGELVTQSVIDIICRLALRNNIWCKLETKDMYVHFGYDYYMYIAAVKLCESTLNEIKKSGLFVESFQSPYTRIL